MGFFNRSLKVSRLSPDQLADIVEGVLFIHSPEVLEELRDNIPVKSLRMNVLVGTPYWTCAQCLDRYMVEKANNVADSKNKLLVFNLNVFDEILEDRDSISAKSKDEIRDRVGKNINNKKHENATESFVHDCLIEILRYEAIHNPSDPNPDLAQVSENLAQSKHVIDLYFKMRGKKFRDRYFEGSIF